ncbi:hypothetical protein RSOL_193030 [Rhizoctonia solani AG-3 Rhs1AP]|uniref:Uncharacterized protein n=1 Tax=Rhizoctonia solani AG-3 Rhs1AP TaxID=1086054 RepID=X8J5B4_9AGAM|nr:hypothetical protein RSOL_193030 [Rhizoctonia solani AG-3 Rhs1AP]
MPRLLGFHLARLSLGRSLEPSLLGSYFPLRPAYQFNSPWPWRLHLLWYRLHLHTRVPSSYHRHPLLLLPPLYLPQTCQFRDTPPKLHQDTAGTVQRRSTVWSPSRPSRPLVPIRLAPFCCQFGPRPIRAAIPPYTTTSQGRYAYATNLNLHPPKTAKRNKPRMQRLRSRWRSGRRELWLR